MTNQQTGKEADAQAGASLAQAIRARLQGGQDFDTYLLRLDRLATIGTLSASMAHEIKNSLVAGKTFIDLLLEKEQDAELVGIVRRELARIDSLVGRILRFAGPERTVYAAISLHEVIEHSLKLVQPRLDDQSIGITRSFRAACDTVSGDAFQLQQAFVNLFLNALEAMTPHGMLTVETQASVPSAELLRVGSPEDSPQVLIRVRDTGRGIAPEQLRQLFQPFFTTKEEGTGLGLAITRHIIEEHRGTIGAESEPSRGTVFSIVLPALMVSE